MGPNMTSKYVKRVLWWRKCKMTSKVRHSERGSAIFDRLLLKLFNHRWDPRHVNHLVTMFRDISLSDSELRFVITKVIRLLKDLDLQELPPLIYQLLLLATKVSLSTTFHLFGAIQGLHNAILLIHSSCSSGLFPSSGVAGMVLKIILPSVT